MRDLYINFVVVQYNFLKWGFNRQFNHDIQWESSRSITFLVWCYAFSITFSIVRAFSGREFALDWFYAIAGIAAIFSLYVGYLHHERFYMIRHEVNTRKLSRYEKLKALAIIFMMPPIVVTLFSI